jgi:hypothetical protein
MVEFGFAITSLETGSGEFEPELEMKPDEKRTAYSMAAK